MRCRHLVLSYKNEVLQNPTIVLVFPLHLYLHDDMIFRFCHLVVSYTKKVLFTPLYLRIFSKQLQNPVIALRLLGLSCFKMDSSQLIASVAVALDKLQCRMEQSNSRSDEMKLEIMIWGLRVVRTFLLCTTQLTEGNSDDDILCAQKQMMMKQDNSEMRENLRSLLVMVEDVVRKILDDHILYEPFYFRLDMKSCEEEMDKWYTSLSDYLKKYPTSPMGNQIKAIMDSVLENLKDYLLSKRSYDFDLESQLEEVQTLKKNITIMVKSTCLGTLLCAENQEFGCLLTQIEPLAVSAAHVALHLFSNIEGPMHLPNDVTCSMLSSLLSKISHVDNTLVYEKYNCQWTDEVVGFEDEKAAVVNRLMRGMEKLQAVSIVGRPELSCIKMDSSRLIALIVVALDKPQFRGIQFISRSDELKFDIMRKWLRAIRTFLLCSTKLTDDFSYSMCYQKQKTKSRMINELGSLLVSFEGIICMILNDNNISYVFLYGMKSCADEMNNWYTSLSNYLKKYPTFCPVPSQIKVIIDSVLEILKDYLISERIYEFDDKELMKALKRNFTVMRHIISFGALLCTENQEFECLLTHIEPLAISAAHLLHHLFNYRPIDVPSSMLSALLLKINHARNPVLREKYTLALASLNHSSQLRDFTLDLNDNPSIMELCIVSLLSILWEMLQLATIRVSMKELELYERLGLLRILVKRQPDRFDDDKIRNLTASAILDAGIQIFSLWQKDSVNGQCFQDNSEVIWAEVLKVKIGETSRFNFCKTNVLGFLDFLLENYLMEVNSSKADSKSCVPKIKEHLVFLKSFMGKLAKLRNQKENLHQDVWNLATQMVYEIEFLIDQLVLRHVLNSFSMSLQSITENIVTLKAKADCLYVFNDQERMDKAQEITWPSADKVRLLSGSQVADEVVGFKSEKHSIVNRLMGGFQQLQVVAIVGMGGSGKTTLATKVYKDSCVTYHFHVKAFCSISQVFNRRRVLLALLHQIQPGESNSAMNEDDLSQKLWRSLRKRRYLIFIDDIWDTTAFDLLKGSLPNDSNQSRILLTSRHSDVVPEDLLDGQPLFLPQLTDDESLELLRKKLFPAQKDWPSELHEFGMKISKCCKGLPLTVVIIAGLLKTTEQEDWKDVLKALRSSISDVTDQCESTIELSYKHLPDHLKPCFLWFGAFPEDHEYSVKRMIWLWIAEGLVLKSESKSLEEVALDYMNTLIGRSLVMSAGRRRCLGGFKACRIHDLLREFCWKASEDSFYQIIKEQEELSCDESQTLSCLDLGNLRRLCVYSKADYLNGKVFCPWLRSLLFFHPRERDQKIDVSYIFCMLKLLRVLSIDTVGHTGFPSEMGCLVQLRYLAIQVSGDVSPEIGKFSKLETLILHVVGGVVSLPDAFWTLQKLRHVHSNHAYLKFPTDESDSPCNLLELETLSGLYVTDRCVMEKQLKKFPNIRQMKCKLHLDNEDDSASYIMDFSFPSQLESLSLSCSSFNLAAYELTFPENLKKLSLHNTKIPWNKIACIAKLPHLEVVKLLHSSFLGDTWHVEEGDFPELKFLRLEVLDLVKWTAACDDLFPNLEKFVLRNCHKLEEISECLEDVATLETIEVEHCTDDVVSLVKKVYEFHKEMGNSALQFHERGTLHKHKSYDKQSPTPTDLEDLVTPLQLL